METLAKLLLPELAFFFLAGVLQLLLLMPIHPYRKEKQIVELRDVHTYLPYRCY